MPPFFNARLIRQYFAGDRIEFTASGNERILVLDLIRQHDAESRFLRWPHIPVFHMKRILYNVAVQSGEVRRYFHNQRIRASKSTVDVLHKTTTRPPSMRGN